MLPPEASEAHDLPRGVLASRRRWAVAVASSVLVPLALWAAGLPVGVVAGIALAIALLAIGDLVLDEMLERRDVVRERLGRLADRQLEVLVAEFLERPTHDPFREARGALGSLVERGPDLGLSADELESLCRARELIGRIAGGISDSRPVRESLRIKGGTELDLSRLSDDIHDPLPGEDMIPYADPANLPGWVPPIARGPLVRTGAVLDQVRRLHNAQIETAVLLFTLWSRLLLVAFAPLLAGLSYTRVPLEDGFSARDVPYVLALTCCVATALIAPWLVRQVMRRDAEGARVRRTLLAIEVPVAVAVILASPFWMVATFAAGWTNWWQRPVFNWVKLAAWVVAVVGCMVVGAALASDLGPATALNAVIAMAVIGMIGGSYGAMLPVSASVLVRVVLGGLVHPRRARRTADEQVSRAVEDLRQAARLTELHAGSTDHGARDDAQRLREIAAELAASSRRDDGWARALPLDLASLIEQALVRRVPRAGSPAAALRADEAAVEAEPPPLELAEISFADKLAPALRFADKKHAATLAQFLDVAAGEATAHGSGMLTVVCGVHDSQVRLRLANPVRDPPTPSGTGFGAGELERLRRQLPGATIPVREEVSGEFIDLLPSQRRWGVELLIPLALFKTGDNR